MNSLALGIGSYDPKGRHAGQICNFQKNLSALAKTKYLEYREVPLTCQRHEVTIGKAYGSSLPRLVMLWVGPTPRNTGKIRLGCRHVYCETFQQQETLKVQMSGHNNVSTYLPYLQRNMHNTCRTDELISISINLLYMIGI